MIFRNFAETLLGSKVKLKVVLDLLNRGVPASERELARVLGLSHVAVNKAMKDLEMLNFVTPVRIGSALVWAANKESYAYQVLRDLRQLRVPPLDFLRQELFLELGPLSNVKQAHLFGSIVKGDEFPNSDIDLLILAEDKRSLSGKLVQLAKQVSDKYGNGLHPTVLDNADLKKPANKRILEEALRNGISVISR